jgi:hypothetical protein
MVRLFHNSNGGLDKYDVLKASSDATTDDVTSLFMLQQDDNKMAAGADGNCFATEMAIQSSLLFSMNQCICIKTGSNMTANTVYFCLIVNVAIRTNSMRDLSSLVSE